MIITKLSCSYSKIFNDISIIKPRVTQVTVKQDTHLNDFINYSSRQTVRMEQNFVTRSTCAATCILLAFSAFKKEKDTISFDYSHWIINQCRQRRFTICDLCKVRSTVEHIIVQCRKYTNKYTKRNSFFDWLKDEETVLKLIQFF